MRIHRRSVAGAVLAAVLAGAPFSLRAQETGAPAVGETAPAAEAPKVQVSTVEAALAAMEADESLADAARDLLRPKYQEAIEAAKGAAGHVAKAVVYREAIATGAGKVSDLRAQLAALSSVERAAEVSAVESVEELQKELEARRVAGAGAKDDLTKVEADLTWLRERPVQISARVPEAQRELATVQAQLASPQLADDSGSPGRLAERILLEAKEARLLGELAMLKQEELSQAVRENLLRARRDLLTRQVENAGAALEALEAVRNRLLATEAKRAVTDAGTALAETAGKDDEVQALAIEVGALAKEFKEVVVQLKGASGEQDELDGRIEVLSREDQVIQEQLKVGRAGGAMAQRLFNLLQRLPGRRALALRVEERRATLGETRLKALDVEEKLREQAEVERRFAGRSGEAVARIVASRQEVLAKLDTQYGALTRALGELATDEARYLEKVRSVRAYLGDELFWVKSSPPVSARTLTEIPTDWTTLFGARVWPEFGRALTGPSAATMASSVGVALLALGLLVARRRFGAALQQTGTQIQRISTDCYAHTRKALIYTILLALPVPLLMGYMSWALGQAPEASAWLRAVSRGLWWSAVLALPFCFVVAACRRGGLARAHFGWGEEGVVRLRRITRLMAVVYIPAFLVTRISFFGDAAGYFDSLGRTCFVVAHVVGAILLWKLYRPSDGVLTPVMRGSPKALLARTRYLWLPVVVLSPLSLVVLACFGYLYTAVVLSLELVLSSAIIAGGVTLYWLTLRWFMIRERKLALAMAIEERRARQEAAAAEAASEAASEAAGEEETPGTGEVVSVEMEEDELDLSSIGEQTRQLLEFLFGLGVAFAIGWLWSETIPLYAGLDNVRAGGGLSLLNLGQAVLVVIVTVMTYRNLPGFLELAFSARKQVEQGTRVAIVTLCQYGVVAIGLFTLFGVLHVDWAKFGWIAAALSVGLGFGLQEVVANFVCGLILLFERPVRVGDVVTVEGTTGTVTRIRMRATTIINWDRQELVVPNKSIVTNSILNWTLSSSISRIVVVVGVAYGSNTRRAREILLEVANENPLILEDPAPLATFEEFDDSNLTLRLRVYLPDMDNRLRVITELHDEIDRRFTEEGITIAFPQRDLHVRGWEAAGGPGAPETGGE